MANLRWAEFILRERLMYSVRERKQVTNVDFAEYLDVEPEYISHWIKGHRVPKEEILDKVANRLGAEAYSAAGKNPRLPNNPSTRRIAEKLHRLPPEIQGAIADWVDELADRTEQGEDVRNTNGFRGSVSPA
jgi:transcriptional regulator with XRE-family HTH domain